MSNPAQREETILTAALKLAEGQRAAYLQEVCGGDAQLRARVEALLQATGLSADSEKTRVASVPLTEKPGDKIGRYKLLEQIGEGGFGVVYVAEQEEPVRRQVTLKVMKAVQMGMDTKQVIARFEQERQALALMDHPNIAKVLDAGATESGRPYFVMELVKGERITDYCDKNNLTTRQRLDLFLEVCHAIQHAHQNGIIHRDIKPSNILVQAHDGVPVPKVIDFGIAKATGQRLTDKTIYTALGQIIGTLHYMSPEQAAGMDIDTRSDIYSLGVLFYELLTGKTPLDPHELAAAGLGAMLDMILKQEPKLPSTRLKAMVEGELTTTAKRRQTDPPKLIHSVHGDLDWIVMKCLEKDRTRRYETANDLASDLLRHVNNEPVKARRPSWLYRFQKMVKRKKLAFAAGTAMGAAVLAGLAISVVFDSGFAAGTAVGAALLVGLVVAGFLFIQERRAHGHVRTAANKAKIALSAADFSKATYLIAQDQRSDALAYLARSVSLNPSNEAASTRLTTLLASQFWGVPMVLLKHNLAVRSAQFSLDGKRIITASDDRTARVWDAQTGQPLTKPLQHGGVVRSAQFSLDGKRIVTASNRAARVWDAQTGQPLTKPLQHNNDVKSAQFSPDGRRIVTASRDNTALVWDTLTGQSLTEPLKHTGGVNSAQFSPDGNRVVTASRDNTAQVWDAVIGQPLTEPLQHTSGVNSAQFSPDGKRIVTASYDSTAQVWDAQSGRPLNGPLQHTSVVNSAEFSPDGKRVVTASEDGTARVWDAVSGKLLIEPLKHDGKVLSARFSPDGKRIVTASDDNTARVWDVQSGMPMTEPFKHDGPVNSVQFSPHVGLNCILTASFDGIARAWSTQGGQPLAQPMEGDSVDKWNVEFSDEDATPSAQFSPYGKLIVTVVGCSACLWDARTGQLFSSMHGVKSAQFSPDGWRIVTTLDDTARVWDMHTGQPLTGSLQHKSGVNSAQFSPDSKLVVTTSSDNTARVWDAQSGQLLGKSVKHSFISSVRFSPDGKRIVTASADGTAQVWDALSGQALTEPLRHNGFVLSAQFSPDGKRVVTASQDRTVRVWDAQSGQPLTEPLNHNSIVKLAQFSPDGRRIVTASQDRTVRMWDAQSGQPLTEPLKYSGEVPLAQFSPDGNRVVTASQRTARVWDVQTGQPLTEPLKYGGDATSAQFSPDGKRIVTAAWGHIALVWDISPSPANYPVWLPELVEAISGQTLNKQGLLEPTRLDRAETINRIRQELNQQPDDEDWVHWGRWFLADPTTRTISPFSKMTVPEYIEDRIKNNTAASLAEAESLAAGNPELSERIAQALSRLVRKTGVVK